MQEILDFKPVSIRLRNIPSKDLDSILEAVSKHFKVDSLSIRKRGVKY